MPFEGLTIIRCCSLLSEHDVVNIGFHLKQKYGKIWGREVANGV